MIPAFWDSSALAPLCLFHEPTAVVRQMLQRFDIVVWWATPVEIRGAFACVLRTGESSASEVAVARERLEELQTQWREVQPSAEVRMHAQSLLDRYSLRAADALQLTAAWEWASGVPRDHVSISADAQLVDAARLAGFDVVRV